MASLLNSARPAAPLKGSEVPRIWTPPLRELTEETTLGYECIAFADEIMGMDLMPWQKWLLIHALEINPDGNFRFRKIVLLVARQSGKSTLMQIVSLWRMYADDCKLVIGTAQNLDVAEEVWASAVEIAEGVPELAAEIKKVVKNSGRKALELQSGSRYRVAAASRRGGRGLSGELVLLDELREHQNWDAWAAVTKTTNAKERAQIWGVSNAGDATSVVLRYLRKMAHKAIGDPDGINSADEPSLIPSDLDDEDENFIDDTVGIFEWSATPGCSVHDRARWAQANPALGYRVTERVISGDAHTDPEWVFRTEVLCQWSDGSLEGPFPPGAWEAGMQSTEIVGKVAACVDVSADQSMAVIAFAGVTVEGTPRVEIVARRAGTHWVEPWLLERLDIITGVTGQGRGAPVSGLLDEWEAGGLPIIKWEGADLAAGTSAFYNLVRANGLHHSPQPVLDVAAATASTKPAGDGVWLWDRRKSATDIAPLVAATGAVWLLQRPVEKPFLSAYADRGVEVI